MRVGVSVRVCMVKNDLVMSIEVNPEGFKGFTPPSLPGHSRGAGTS